MSEQIAAHEWCWTCGERRGGSGRYVHRADYPVLAHDRCGVCNDVLMPYPQPTLAQKLDHLGTHLREATKWSRVVAADDPTDDERSLALGEIRELLLQAQRVLMRLEDTQKPAPGRS